MKNVLTAPEQVTPKWLTNALRKNGFLKRGKVTSVQIKLTKTLALSVVSRLEASYSPNAVGSVPSKLFLKIPRTDLAKGVSSEHNRQEIEFYNTIAGEMSNPPFISCFDAAYSSESGKSHLLLDDLSETHFQPEPPQPPSTVNCKSAVKCLAQLHAFWWEHPRLGKDVGKLFDENRLTAFVGDVEKNIVGFIDFLGDELSAAQRKIYDRLLASKHKIWGRLTDAAGLTVTHGDAHWWNFLYPCEMDKHRVCLFDWQLWHIDVGARDLAFMVALGGYSKRRAAMEQSLVRCYYDGLVTHGVKNFTWDDCWDDYRWSAIRNLNVPVIQWSQGRSAELWRSNLEKAMFAYKDLKCSDLIGN